MDSELPILFWLIVAHFVADFPLQSPAIAVGKNHRIERAHLGVPWYYWLTAHAATHAGAVAVVTGSVAFGCVEFVVHWLIDHAKCRGWTNIHADQWLHVACKVAYVIAIGVADAH